ncbi:(2Fe-2S)-binding protein [Halobellus rubicundus]|uniref:(2Fe-2S)-binding protein n=1 Tax=Halobellus rubicundus TaxID=2996466 RepID=A0ABD5MFU8_9EURY
MEIRLTLNGEEIILDASRSDSLLDVLRRAGYTGTKRGCETGDCGFCTVLVEGDAVKSCIRPAARADESAVETIENLGTQADLHPIQAAFVDNAALQCGFCTPGMIMRTKALLAENPDPEKAEIREALSGNLCRCTGYENIVSAVVDAADRLAAGDRSDAATDGGRQRKQCTACDYEGVQE